MLIWQSLIGQYKIRVWHSILIKFGPIWQTLNRNNYNYICTVTVGNLINACEILSA